MARESRLGRRKSRAPGGRGAVAMTLIGVKTFQGEKQKTDSNASTTGWAFPADLHDGEHYSEPQLSKMSFLQKFQPSD